jgi:hypothetical protein
MPRARSPGIRGSPEIGVRGFPYGRIGGAASGVSPCAPADRPAIDRRLDAQVVQRRHGRADHRLDLRMPWLWPRDTSGNDQPRPGRQPQPAAPFEAGLVDVVLEMLGAAGREGHTRHRAFQGDTLPEDAVRNLPCA